MGMVRAILFDGIVQPDEVLGIIRFLEKNSALIESYPGHQLYKRAKEIVADGVISPEECVDFAETLYAAIGENPSDGSDVLLATRLPIDSPPPPLEFQERSFCFTGKFAYGTRKKCEDAVRDLGGMPMKGVTMALDYLVIGIMPSRDWLESTHGTKIIQAVDFRQRYPTLGKPLIISEEYLVSRLH
jgi:NAD-dependent DNA ligase